MKSNIAGDINITHTGPQIILAHGQTITKLFKEYTHTHIQLYPRTKMCHIIQSAQRNIYRGACV